MVNGLGRSPPPAEQFGKKTSINHFGDSKRATNNSGVLSLYSPGYVAGDDVAGDESDISMTHYGMWKVSDEDHHGDWSYVEEKPMSHPSMGPER